MKKIINPTGASLSALQPEGTDFSFSNQTGEMTAGLQDLIQKNDYNVNIHLRPLGNAYEITGKIETKMNVLCSRCGRDAELPIKDDFRELILVEDDRPRGSQSGHVGAHLTASGPYCNYVSTDYFDLLNFVHEHIAASEPYIVECGKKDCEEAMLKAQLATQAPVNFDTENTNPFAALKNVKLR